MSCTLFIFWISLAALLSTVVLVTDSCSSSFGLKAKRSETSTNTVTIVPTTPNFTIMTATMETTEASTSDKTPRQDGYAHVKACDGMYASDFCLNGGTCYRHQYLQSVVFVCECPTHFHGIRCEEKQLEGSYGGGMIRIRRSNRRRRRSHSSVPVKFTGKKGHPVHHRNHRFSSTISPTSRQQA